MKRRFRYTLNFLSFSLLAFALYLNFVKRESEEASMINTKENSQPLSGKQETKPVSERGAVQKLALK